MGRLNMAGLRPEHDVLDVGCGVGRTARFLCDYLSADARYEGFDIVEMLIDWCQAEITPRFPNFRFRYIPLFNSEYLPDAALPSAAELRFPYPDESFDFVFAHSVFTHLWGTLLALDDSSLSIGHDCPRTPGSALMHGNLVSSGSQKKLALMTFPWSTQKFTLSERRSAKEPLHVPSFAMIRATSSARCAFLTAFDTDYPR